MSLLSIVLPAYNEEAMLPRTAETLTAIMEDAGITFELVFVDDGSGDDSWKIMND